MPAKPIASRIRDQMTEVFTINLFPLNIVDVTARRTQPAQLVE
jgi:hypothetical protein